MKALFAMDLMGRKTVRLVKGDFERVTVYSDDPLSKIEEMVDKGARDFHIVDLDGARTGETVHRDLIAGIRKRVPGYMEVGGGIRTLDDITSYKDLGVNGVILGTRALEDEEFFESLSGMGSIVLGLDLHEGRPMARGWKRPVDRPVEDLLAQAARIGVLAILCTSIARDGMLSGPDYDGLKKIGSLTRLPLIASGGVTTIDDVRALRDMKVWAAILGKAVYEGLIPIEEATTYAD